MTQIPPRKSAPQIPQNQLVFQHSHMPGGEPETFQDQMRDAMKSAPWYLISIGFHAILFLMLSNMVWSQHKGQESLAIQAEAMPENLDILEEEPPPPPEEPPEEREEEIEDPVVSEEEVEQTVEEEDNRAPLDAPFEGRSLNDVIGAGGGAGGGFGGKYGRRGSGKGGGTAQQKAVGLGLEWLKNHQDPQGFWDCDDFSNMCKLNICNGKGDALHDVGVTGIALLAFLGAGNTMNTGPYKAVVQKGLRYLEGMQNKDSGLFGTNAGQHFMYDHSLATLAMLEGYTLSKVPVLKRPAQMGVNFIVQNKNPYKAWRYAAPPDGDNDVSVTGWMLFALFAAQEAPGIQVDENAIKDGMNFIEEMTDQATWRTGYHERGSYPAREPEDVEAWPAEYSESMTAVALLLRAFNHEDPGTPAMENGADLLVQKTPDWDEDAGKIDFYYWYYASYALWQIGGKRWNTWQAKMVPSIVDHQRQDGDEKGSWDPQVDPWGDKGGRVYATAINTLCLEVYYRYDKVFGAR